MSTILKFGCAAIAGFMMPLVSNAADDEWRFRLTPYIWFAGLQGDVGAIPGIPAASVNISPGDALEDTESSLMILLNAQRGRHGLFADFFYSDVRSEDELLPAPINLNLRSTTKTIIGSLAYQYEFYNRDGITAALLGGARYWDIDAELQFGGGMGLLAGKQFNNSESWVDPMAGAIFRSPLGDSRFYLALGAAFGGLGVGSELFYEFNTAVGYQWNDAIGTAVGYRLFEVDYDDPNFSYDVKQQGWQIGLTWSF